MKSLFKKKYYSWYLFPWFVFIFFIEEWRDHRTYRKALSEKEKREARLNKLYQFLSFTISLVLHCIIFFGITIFFMDSENTGQELLIDNAVEFELASGMVASSGIESVYETESGIIVKPNSLSKLSHQNSKVKILDDLLNKLREEKTSTWSKNNPQKSQSQSIGWSDAIKKQLENNLNVENKNQKKLNQKIVLAKLWDRLKISQMNKEYSSTDHKNIMDQIQKYTYQFRDCYEKSLLLDEVLAVKAAFLLNVNRASLRTAKVKLKGQGSLKSRKQLSRCLLNEVKKISFSKNKKNISVRFNLIFEL